MQIIDLKPDDENNVKQAATILFEGFKEIWPHICPNIEAALKEVHKSFAPGKISRIAVNDDGIVLGWIGAIPEYDGNAWCLYPLAVHPGYRERGVGRALVSDLERLVRDKGAVTLYLVLFHRNETHPSMDLTKRGKAGILGVCTNSESARSTTASISGNCADCNARATRL